MEVVLLYAVIFGLEYQANYIRRIDMNVPIAGVAALLVLLFLDVRVPRMSLGQKLRALDWM